LTGTERRDLGRKSVYLEGDSETASYGRKGNARDAVVPLEEQEGDFYCRS